MELWSGAIGAALSAVLAALVAVFVVWKTNKHQSELAKKALDAQREDAAEALRVQRELLEQQIHEQRQEARWAEKTRALADFVAGVREMSAIHSDTDILVVGEIGRRLEAAAASLDILGEDDEGLYALLHPSIRTLYRLGVHRVTDFQLNMTSGVGPHLHECARAICSLAPKWWSREDGHERKFIRGEILLTLQHANKHLDDMKSY